MIFNFDFTLECLFWVFTFFHFDGNSWNLTLTLGIAGKEKWLKEMAPYTSMTMRQDMRKIMYSNNMRTNGNELMSRLLPGITTSELQNLVRMRGEARRPIPSVQMRGGEARRPIPTPRRMIQNRPIRAPRIKKQQSVAAPRTVIDLFTDTAAILN